MGQEAAQVIIALLVRCRLLERHHACATRVQVLGEAPYRPAPARRVSALENDQQALPRCFDRLLQLQQLNLERLLGALIRLPSQQLRVGITLPPRLDVFPVRTCEYASAAPSQPDLQAEPGGELLKAGRVIRAAEILVLSSPHHQHRIDGFRVPRVIPR